MTSERSLTLAIALLMALVGAVAWAFQLRPALQVDASPLARLPMQLEGWESREIPLEQTVESMLRADFNVQRAFRHPMGDIVWLYIGYYGTDRGGTPEHTPPHCYRSNGWTIKESQTLVVDAARGLRGNEMIVEMEGTQRLVLFWYRSFRSTGILGTLGLRFDHVLGRLTQGRADGALVRLSTPFEPGTELTARSRLVAFAGALEPLIDRHWPTEAPIE